MQTVDYAFCKAAKLTTKDLMIWLDFIDPYYDGYLDNLKLCGRNVRCVGEDSSIIQIGEDNKTFDRWANSVDLEFDIKRPSEKRKFIDFVKEVREGLTTVT